MGVPPNPVPVPSFETPPPRGDDSHSGLSGIFGSGPGFGGLSGATASTPTLAEIMGGELHGMHAAPVEEIVASHFDTWNDRRLTRDQFTNFLEAVRLALTAIGPAENGLREAERWLDYIAAKYKFNSVDCADEDEEAATGVYEMYHEAVMGSDDVPEPYCTMTCKILQDILELEDASEDGDTQVADSHDQHVRAHDPDESTIEMRRGIASWSVHRDKRDDDRKENDAMDQETDELVYDHYPAYDMADDKRAAQNRRKKALAAQGRA